MAKVALVDDHVLLRNGLANLVRDLGHTVVLEADNGIDFTEKIATRTLPEVVLLDINMPKMDGYDTALWLKKNYPDIKILALSMYDDENAIIRMLRNGAKGYILKDSHPSDLKAAIDALSTKGYYYTEMVTGRLIHSINHLDEPGHSSIKEVLGLSQREIDFLKLACTEMTYKEIADQMNISPRTAEGYRDALCQRFDLKSRIGLVLFAIKNGIVNVQ